MTPGARIQSSIELLGAILDSWIPSPRRGEAGRGAHTADGKDLSSEQASPPPNLPPTGGGKRIPADKLIDNYFRARRFLGSKDRATIGELVYWCLRNKATLEWWLTVRLETEIHARAIVLTALILRKDYDVAQIAAMTQDSQYSLPSLTALEKERCERLTKERGAHTQMPPHAKLNYPQWLEPYLKESLGEDFEPALKALSEQASTDLRVNTLKTTREELQKNLQEEGFETIPTPMSSIGLRLPKRMPIFTSQYFKAGHFEVQDEGSQLVALLVDAESGQKIIDFCAGAGGKTLAIAAAMKNKGRILAWDNSEKRLSQIKERLRRAGVDNVQTHVLSSEHDAFIKRHKETANRVLVDAPCSGSGTWRRNPDLKWRFTQKDLDEMLVLQQSILQSASRLVKPGGRLIYATCSIFKNENDDQIERFLKSVNHFRVVCAQKIWDKTSDGGSAPSYLHVTPHQDGVDGFFAAVLEREKK
jgi:16S rRNA (cytosine967-C5)-methyltransferase